jgi:hypothetical protein
VNVARRPVEPEPGVLVHSSADRQLAIEHWLLSTHSAPSRARLEWKENQATLLPLGTLFSAVRIPERLVLAAADLDEGDEVGDFLNRVLDGGPVICDPHQRWYYALVPGSMPATWKSAAQTWVQLGVECLGRGTYLGVPRVDIDQFDPQACVSYWSVPMSSAALLCDPLDVARLIAAAQRRIGEEQDA